MPSSTDRRSSFKYRKFQKKIKRNPKNLAKTTKKGAYRPKNKKQIRKRMQPMVESKTRTAATLSHSLDPARDPTATEGPLNVFTAFPDPTDFRYVPIDDAHTLILPSIFYTQNRGLTEEEMVGSNIYAKFLKTKLQFIAPQGANLIGYPMNMYVIHGWVTAPMQKTTLTTPHLNNVTYVDVFTHVHDYVKEYYNSRKDTLEFPEKRTQHIKFLGYRKLLTDKNQNIPQQFLASAMGTAVNGAIAPINVSCKWDIHRKIHYTHGTGVAANGNPHDYPMADFNYPNNSWLPFIVLFNPQFASTPGYPAAANADLWRVAHNSKIWYNDQ